MQSPQVQLQAVAHLVARDGQNADQGIGLIRAPGLAALHRVHGKDVADAPAKEREFACDIRTVRSEEHTSELQSLMRISYAVVCLKKKIHTYTYEFKHNIL